MFLRCNFLNLPKNWTHISVLSGSLLERNFVFCAWVCQSFLENCISFVSGGVDGKLLVYPVTLFSLDMPEMQVSHICKQRAEKSNFYAV